jgi:predicted phage terminase large subunit-like protein
VLKLSTHLKRVASQLEERHGESFLKHRRKATDSLVCFRDKDNIYIKTHSALARIPSNGREKLERFIHKTTDEHAVISAQEGAQSAFLSCKADYAIYGGAAGGGKSYGIVIDALRGVADKGFSAVLFRRTYRQLELPGGLIDRARLIYSPLKEGVFNGSKYEWKFPSGSKIVFRHLQHEQNIYDYQGAEFCYIGFDELTHFPESAWDYLSSRLRAPYSNFRPYMRATTNPDADSWVAEQIDWWIDPATGFPLKERAGLLRWFVRINGETIWSNDPDDLLKYDAIPRSFTFIPASLADNPALTEGDPTYLAALQALHPVERARLLEGNWKVRFSAGKFFSRSWFDLIHRDNVPRECRLVRFWDIAATDGQVSKQACYTAGILMGFDGKTYYVLDVIAEQFAPDRVFNLMVATAQADGRKVSIRWEKQPAAAGKFLDTQLIELLDGYDATWQDIKGQKTQRALPFARSASMGNVKVVEAEWNDRYFNWLTAFPDAGADVTDASSGAYKELSDSFITPEEIYVEPVIDEWGRY